MILKNLTVKIWKKNNLFLFLFLIFIANINIIIIINYLNGLTPLP